MIRGKVTRIHREVCRRRHGITEADHSRHTCDNRKCVNPDHIVSGTNHDNIRDKIDRERQSYGEGTNNTKLTALLAVEIFKASGTLRKIADKFGVANSTVCLIKNRKSWRRVIQEAGL